MNHQENPIPGETEEQRDIRVNKDIAAFSYVWIMAVIIYIARKDSRFIQYHSKQGIALFLLTIPAAIFPIFGSFLLLLLAAGMVLGFIHAAQGKYEDIPIIGDLAKGNLKVKDIVHSFAKLLEDSASFMKKMFVKHTQETHKNQESARNEDVTHVDTPPTIPVS